MTLKELEEIEARAVKAQEGPWEWNQIKGFGAMRWLWGPKDKRWSPLAELQCGFPTCDFIAHSRVDIPKLCETIRVVKEAWFTRKWQGHDGESCKCPMCQAMDKLPEGMKEELGKEVGS
jgi:hypothetical protein